MKGLLITFEGIDGCGKSTQAVLLKSHLTEQERDVLLVREPGGTDISEQIRSILLNPANKSMDPTTETILLSASRAQLTREVILPSLQKGTTVICDRFADSTLAYQGYGRGLPIEWLRTLNEFATAGRIPDLTFLVDIPVQTAMARLQAKSIDRLEEEGNEFLQRVRDGYLTLAEKSGGRYIVVDGTKPVDSIRKEIIAKLEAHEVL